MTIMPRAHFQIKNRFQKRSELYQDILTPTILEDVCLRVTGQSNYTVAFDNSGYNKGRLAIIEFQGAISYVSFSEAEIRARNSSFQSFPSALVSYHKEQNPNKRICFYFLPSTGNIETAYFIFMYRLMKTARTEFLNETDYLTTPIAPFSTVEDIIVHKDSIRGRNRGNISTYLTRNSEGTLQIYGKTYGANKYETTLLCLAISEITTSNTELYEIQEGNLRKLPRSAREVIDAIDKITIITSDLMLERKEYEDNDSLRSPTFTYNLLEKLGNKKCALCECEIPQLIQSAHIWPVDSIKRTNNINQEQKLQSALDGDNGIWLCNNHHKLFDINLLLINKDGRIKYKSNIRQTDGNYIRDVTINYQIRQEILTSNFIQYLEKRNSLINERDYSFIE
jgi:hypothetical protein